ncbi:hypothetical protein AGOR_G00189530 [Albula goreensis]|uniref:B-cell receptor CD22 n=1 Tax=Albula goreensis TaxID=1534307 RepID=A0A8T3CQK2_9TELE|nr:hypothetical protein AGOR_G00189530 [Albula goreensis]
MVCKTSGVLLAVLYVSGVVGQNGWDVTYTPERICALKGSTVDIYCTYSYPHDNTVQKTSWFTYWPLFSEPEDLSLKPRYRGRVQYLGNKHHDCSLSIADLRESDSATYRFKFLTNTMKREYTGQPGVMLTVTDLQVGVDPDTVTEGWRVTLTCRTTCTLTGRPAFIWYRNNQRLYFSRQQYQITASSGDAGNYSCAVRGYENLPSTALTLNVQYPPKRTSVSVSPSGEIEEGSSVTLTCSSDANPPVQSYTWFEKTGAVNSERGTGESYTITNIRSEDSGQYYCEAQNQHGALNSTAVTIDVQYPPKRTSVSVSPSGGIEEGSSVTLNCSSDANPPVQSYTWFKKNESGVWQTGSGQNLSFFNFTVWKSGLYYCKAENKHGAQNATAQTIKQGVGAMVVLCAAGWTTACLALVLIAAIVCVYKRKKRGTPGETARGPHTQMSLKSACSDPQDDTYTGLDLVAVSPDYDTLNVRAQETASDSNSALQRAAQASDSD